MKKRLTILSLAIALLLTGCATNANDPVSDSPASSVTSQGQLSGESEKPETSEGGEAANGTVTLDFYSINDMHGKFDDTYDNIGVDEMSAYLRNAQTVNENTVLLSAGDMWQGSAESNFTQGNIVTEWMNDLGFVSMTMGNHEYDWGEAAIEENAKLAEFPFLGINIYDAETNERVDYCQPSVMIERSGAQIGVIGAIGDCYSSIAEEQVEDVYFKVGNDLTNLVKNESARLRSQGADAIVYVVHDGEDNYDESLSNGYVDLVFEGHTHQRVNKIDRYGVYHLQAGGDNSYGLSYAQLEVDLSTGDVETLTAKHISHSAYENGSDDPIVDSLLEKYAEVLTPVNTVVGQNDSYRDSDAIAKATAQAMLIKGLERWGSDSKYAGKIVLGGGFINIRSPYYLPAGEVTYGDLYPLLPFDNPLVLCEVSGSRLTQQFINSSNYVCFYGEDGETIKNSVDASATYYVVVDTYCANYNFRGMGFMKIVEYYEDGDHSYYNRHALAEFIYNGGWSKPAIDSTIPEILAIGSALSSGAQTSERYRVTGKIVSIKNATKGILTIEDGDGNQLYVYRCNGFNTMSTPPQIGDTVTLESVIKNYYSTIEFFDATITSVVTG